MKWIHDYQKGRNKANAGCSTRRLLRGILRDDTGRVTAFRLHHSSRVYLSNSSARLLAEESRGTVKGTRAQGGRLRVCKETAGNEAR